MDKEIKRIEKYAKEHNVPIMEKTGIDFLTEYIKEHNVKNILEIGTAIGYSAIKMALVDDKIKVTTIERDNERYLEALKNIKEFGLEKRITLVLGDASLVDVSVIVLVPFSPTIIKVLPSLYVVSVIVFSGVPSAFAPS